MYLPILFKLFLKAVKLGITWPVNIEMKINGKIWKIVDEIVREEYFHGEETHLSFLNLYNGNVASVQMEDILYTLLKLFHKNQYKYILTLENSEHSC